MTVRGMFRSFIEGLILIALAGFVLGAVNYVASIIPESTLSVGNVQTSKYIPPQLIGTWNPSYGYCAGRCYSVYEVHIGDPPANMSYLIMIQMTVAEIIVRLGDRDYGLSVVTNGTHSFAKWSGAIDTVFVGVDSNPVGESITIYAIDSRIDPPPPSGYLESTSTGSALGAQVSNKLIVNVIVWVASIMLVVTALHKMGVPI